MVQFLKAFLIINLLILNIAVGFLVYRQILIPENSDLISYSTDGQSLVQIQEVDRCGPGCVQTIKDELARQISVIPTVKPIPTVTVNPTPTIKVVPQSAKKTRTIEYMTIPGSGFSSQNDWANLTGTEFYFDTRDFPGLVEVYFEANIKLQNGNGRAYVRLYDVTHEIGVNGSDNDTTNQSDTWTVSQKVYFWQGRNLIRVQAKSLTADTAVYNQGRLRIVREE